jgi:hypothetical protein
MELAFLVNLHRARLERVDTHVSYLEQEVRSHPTEKAFLLVDVPVYLKVLGIRTDVIHRTHAELGAQVA